MFFNILKPDSNKFKTKKIKKLKLKNDDNIYTNLWDNDKCSVL